ncbi:MAG: hypothetical protein AB8I08_10595 [Sandaracinaceae bacterium]
MSRQVGPEAGSEEASGVIWRWQDRSDERAKKAASQRKAGLVRAGVGVVAGAVLFYFDRPVVAGVAGSLAGLTLVLAVASPLGAYAALDRAVAGLGRGVGLVLTWLLLAPAYYLMLTPLAWAVRARRDPLRREIDPKRASYWSARTSRPLDRPY